MADDDEEEEEEEEEDDDAEEWHVTVDSCSLWLLHD